MAHNGLYRANPYPLRPRSISKRSCTLQSFQTGQWPRDLGVLPSHQLWLIDFSKKYSSSAYAELVPGALPVKLRVASRIRNRMASARLNKPPEQRNVWYKGRQCLFNAVESPQSACAKWIHFYPISCERKYARTNYQPEITFEALSEKRAAACNSSKNYLPQSTCPTRTKHHHRPTNKVWVFGRYFRKKRRGRLFNRLRPDNLVQLEKNPAAVNPIKQRSWLSLYRYCLILWQPWVIVQKVDIYVYSTLKLAKQEQNWE